MPFDNLKNYEIHRIQLQNHEHHENLIISDQTYENQKNM